MGTLGIIGTIILVFLVAILIIAVIYAIEIAIVYVIANAMKKYDKPLPTIDERSGKGAASEVPAEIKGWNWGAAFVPMIWGIYHNTWFFLLNTIPGLQLVWWIALGIKGNEWAWRNNKWESVEEFQRIQNRWRPVGIFFGVVKILAITYSFAMPIFIMGSIHKAADNFAPNDFKQMWSTTSTRADTFELSSVTTTVNALPAATLTVKPGYKVYNNDFALDKVNFTYPKTFYIQGTSPSFYAITANKGVLGKIEIFRMKDFGDRPWGFEGTETVEDLDGYVPKEQLIIKSSKETYDVWLYYSAKDTTTKKELHDIYNSIVIK